MTIINEALAICCRYGGSVAALLDQPRIVERAQLWLPSILYMAIIRSSYMATCMSMFWLDILEARRFDSAHQQHLQSSETSYGT
jgi:hypothetical protein